MRWMKPKRRAREDRDLMWLLVAADDWGADAASGRKAMVRRGQVRSKTFPDSTTANSSSPVAFRPPLSLRISRRLERGG